jgi:hypothetical protein
MVRPLIAVILSAVAASLSEAAAESKDPYELDGIAFIDERRGHVPYTGD